MKLIILRLLTTSTLSLLLVATAQASLVTFAFEAEVGRTGGFPNPFSFGETVTGTFSYNTDGQLDRIDSGYAYYYLGTEVDIDAVYQNLDTTHIAISASGITVDSDVPNSTDGEGYQFLKTYDPSSANNGYFPSYSIIYFRNYPANGVVSGFDIPGDISLGDFSDIQLLTDGAYYASGSLIDYAYSYARITSLTNITGVSAVPEPSHFAAMGILAVLGISGAVVRRRRRKTRSLTLA